MAKDSQGRMTLEDLIALSDELAALARAGVPFEPGLRCVAREWPRRLGRVAQELSESIAQGHSIVESMHKHAAFPPAYRAVAEAGIRSGRLSAALEGIASTSRRATEIRELTLASMIYPLIVLAVVTTLLLISMSTTIPQTIEILRQFRLELPVWYVIQLRVGEWLSALLPLVWLLSVIGLAIWYFRSRSASSVSPSWLPLLSAPSRLMLEGQRATFSEVLALMIEQRVPLVEALPLAGEATGNTYFHDAARQLAVQFEQGSQQPQYPPRIPPLVAWTLTSGFPPPHLVEMLRRGAQTHRDRARELAVWVGVYLPIVFAAGLGGLLALFYVTLVLSPFYHLLQSLP